MSEVYIFDAVRTPRGRGKADGRLHDVTPTQLAAQLLAALRDRNALDTALVDDIVLGCVEPVGEQGADIARTAALIAGYDRRVVGVQINRFCASGLETVNMAAAKVAFGETEGVTSARFWAGGFRRLRAASFSTTTMSVRRHSKRDARTLRAATDGISNASLSRANLPRHDR